ncbi:hypothetical protein [Candidatus Nitrospira inopinata]|jgi:hypothetical protein|uniref:Uncharacterized protein n=1 Tax=Candidatus Nitrospira inopinata TaxID=1715989 RepID=A0A0S4KKP6_9BACT|nr:hypothetical protein [Candidatus Nitrospira inopinata]CUQ64988.1 protein of unknown function [Candidatus Nitrospira inopinata]
MIWLKEQPCSLDLPTAPIMQTLREIRRSPRWTLFQGRRPRWKNRQAGLIGSGTRKGQALIKRLARLERAETIEMGRRNKTY